MEVLVNSATKAQISTMPSSEQRQTDQMLRRLAREFPEMPNLKRLATVGNLWELRINARLRALLRVENQHADVLAVARPEQLQRYWRQELAS